jgi:dipeptidyl aminopeptidase/acylaminoacyl peptidase
MTGALEGQASRAGATFTVEDVLKAEEIGDIALSPDGRWVATVVLRARGPGEIYQRTSYAVEARGDVWVARTDGSGLRNLTEGRSTGDASWAPSWSPDGHRLAFLSTRGGNVHAWVWSPGPPWTNLWRYLKNSPVYYLDRVTTPLLLIHGDQDHVPIQGAEEVFTGLHRLGKRVRFVRYFGEGHLIDSPANIRDMWARIFAWLAETMPPDSPISHPLP